MEVERALQRRNRGKLYSLSPDSAWEDRGTGYVSIGGQADSRRLIFQDEETGEILHDRRVWPSDTYRLQGEGERQSIIVWEDPESHQDWALSFQEPADLAGLWDEICLEKRVLPLPDLGSLTELSRALTYVPPSQREALASECVKERFLTGLQEAFHTAEDLGDEEVLCSLWRVAKGIFLLANQKLTERYLRQDVYQDILGMLEYDEGLPLDRRVAHRQIHKMQVQFNEVITFDDPDILDRIHLIYRLQYVKDIVLPRLLDDATFAAMTQMVHANLSVVLDHLQKNAKLLEALFLRLREGDVQSLVFLMDACRLSRQVAPSQRQAMFERMVNMGLFATLAPFLKEPGSRCLFGAAADGPVGSAARCTEGPLSHLRPRHMVVEILLLCGQSDATSLRSYLTSEGAESRDLLSTLIHVIHAEGDQGVQTQVAEVLKSVMDMTGLEGKAREECLAVFYDRGALDEIVAPLRSRLARPRSDPSAAFGVQLACDLLAFAATHHSFRAKGYFTRGGFAEPLGRLFTAQQRFLHLAPVRLMRVLVATMDDLYHRYLVRSGLLGPVMRTFQQSLRPPALGGGLFVSAVLSLLEFIRAENVKVLVDHICRRHQAMLQELAPRFKTLENLLVRHRHNVEAQALPLAVPSPADSQATEPMRPSSPGTPGSGGKEEDSEALEQAKVDPYQDELAREDEPVKAEEAEATRSSAAPAALPLGVAECGAEPLLAQAEPPVPAAGQLPPAPHPQEGFSPARCAAVLADADTPGQDVPVGDASDTTTEGAGCSSTSGSGLCLATTSVGDTAAAIPDEESAGDAEILSRAGVNGAGHATKRAGHTPVGRATRAKGKGRGRQRLTEVAPCPANAGVHIVAAQGPCVKKFFLSHASKRLRTSSPPVVAS